MRFRALAEAASPSFRGDAERDTGGGAYFSKRIVMLQESLDVCTQNVEKLQRRVDHDHTTTDGVRQQISRIDDYISKSKAELVYIQQQLEQVVIGVEKERGIVADHSEQLRYLVRESNKEDGGARASSGSGKSALMVMGMWLYRPVVHFAKGVYTLLTPIASTFLSLSLFNYDVIQRQEDVCLRSRWSNAGGESLLGLLQLGALDPAVVVTATKK